METNKIIHADCIEYMRTLPNNCVDLIITDPPYGDNVAYGWNNKTIRNNENPLINCSALVEMYRVLKRNRSLYLFTNWKHYPFLTEFILILEKGKPKYNLKNFSDVQTCSHINHNKLNHPHEKPIDLLMKMVEHSSKEGDLVLDPFAGSGSTCKACKKMGRKWIGIELDEKWIDSELNFAGGENGG